MLASTTHHTNLHVLVVVWTVYFGTEFHTPDSKRSLLTAIRTNANYRLHDVAIFCFIHLQCKKSSHRTLYTFWTYDTLLLYNPALSGVIFAPNSYAREFAMLLSPIVGNCNKLRVAANDIRFVPNVVKLISRFKTLKQGSRFLKKENYSKNLLPEINQ
jgi:hypothetical protein